MKYAVRFRRLGLACAAALSMTSHAACPPSHVDAIGAYFSPLQDDDGFALALIEQANRRVLVAGYPALSPQLARALREARLRGVDVHVVLDRSRAPWRYSGATTLARAGVDVAVLRARAPGGDRFVVADDAVALGAAGYRTVEGGWGAGGFNLFRHAPELAGAYAGEFWRMRGQSTRE
jgi:hypothetical protein